MREQRKRNLARLQTSLTQERLRHPESGQHEQAPLLSVKADRIHEISPVSIVVGTCG